MKKNQKYNNWLHFTAAYAYRHLTYFRIKDLVSWQNTQDLEDGCTVILGMASRLPDLLPANLSCLNNARWPELRQTLITVDTTRDRVNTSFEADMMTRFPDLNISFLYYNEQQFQKAEKLHLPYIYSWLSWVIALNQCKTKTVLIHDYDALVLKNVLEKRYLSFLESGVKIQGVKWYEANGIVEEDHLSSTFEAFADVNWIKKYSPLQMFNKVGLLHGRRVDFDTLLHSQTKLISKDERSIFPMSLDELVHPTQMIHQYTMAKKFPGKPWFCSALIMIPFFYYLSGKNDFLLKSSEKIMESTFPIVDLLDDGTPINFERLTTGEVHKMLKNMLQVCVSHKILPFTDLIEYGNALYDMTDTPPLKRWTGKFTEEQKTWINSTTKDQSANPSSTISNQGESTSAVEKDTI